MVCPLTAAAAAAAQIAATRNGSEWHPLAELIAENRRGTHAFRLPWERWAKYLQIRFESHYGNQKVCAINEIQVRIRLPWGSCWAAVCVDEDTQ